MAKAPKLRANVRERFVRCEICNGRRYVALDPPDNTRWENCLRCRATGLVLDSKEITYLNVPIGANDEPATTA